MRLLFATGNAGKLREAREILGPSFDLLSPADAGISGEPEETGDTFRENALQKARWYQERCGLPCFADDSGLEVDALGGAPGIYSARYAGEGHDFAANIDKLLKELSRCGNPVRSARFRCCVALLLPGEEPRFFDGAVEGRIGTRKAGCGGFGYDPVFIPDAYPDRTLAEVEEAAKNAISHRGVALRAMTAWLAANLASS
ncbi:MAG: RdgB/HAM1 family non-canonical purine NTP pyrophosphatase [Bacteroidales bacterium]|nr:RdgB/HAM1 family non-canonical purine NTP pyrophosphatase [Bacteroidales bacterium]